MRELLLPLAYGIPWRGRTLCYRPADGSVTWAEPPRQVSHEPWSPPHTFEPRCLTVAVRGACCLACAYCYGGTGRGPLEMADNRAIAAAAELVAASCRRQGLPLLVGFHGSSEPLQDRERINAAVAVLRQVARRYNLALRLACTTNGQLDGQGVRWLATTFDSVTVSLDGSAATNDRQRPTRSGEGSTARTEACLQGLLGAPKRPEEIVIRATITRHNADHLETMVPWLLDRFPVDRLVLHPVYGDRPGAAEPSLAAEPHRLIPGLLKARRAAAGRGVPLVLPGARAGERHGRFCPILQHNLTLTPDGHATACFLALHDSRSEQQRYFFGHHDPARGDLVIDEHRLQELLTRCSRPRPTCRSCFNLRHCSQGCPGHCPLVPLNGATRCQVSKAIGLATLLEAAGVELDDRNLAELVRVTEQP